VPPQFNVCATLIPWFDKALKFSADFPPFPFSVHGFLTNSHVINHFGNAADDTHPNKAGHADK